MNKKPTGRDFDGHLEKPLNKMTPKEKLDYIWSQIELKNYIKNKIVKKHI
jgi:hypothetical protein